MRFLVLLLALAVSPLARAETLEGYTVSFHERVAPAAAEKVRAHLGQLLRQLRQVAPRLSRGTAGQVTFWVTDSKAQNAAATYHPSPDWLREHGFDPKMARGIEILSVENFLQWSVEGDQPMMVLHELAHAYHHQVLGYEDPRVSRSFQNAVAAGKYASVAYHAENGPKQRAYALTNEKEYFAEIAEAYFGRNDFFPFQRSELQSYDPEGFRLVESTLGAP